jgi:hypothetical protein
MLDVNPVVIEKLRPLGLSPNASTPDKFKDRIEADIKKWSEVVAATRWIVTIIAKSSIVA